MSLFDEFKTFAMRGNAIDLAIGVVIGASFQKIVDSLVNDIIMPPIGAIVGKVDFSSLYINLSSKAVTSIADAKAKSIPTLNYGLFFNQVLSFFIVAFALFLMVKAMNRLRRKQEKIAAALRAK